MTSIYSVTPAWGEDSGVDADSGLYVEPPLTWAEEHEDDDEGGGNHAED